MTTISISCPINNLSYGIVSTNILDQFTKMGQDYRLKPMAQFDTNEFGRFLDKCIKFDEKLDMFVPSLKIWHEHSLFDHIGKGPRVGFPIFEKDIFNPLDAWNIRHQDMVLVASHWAQDVVKQVNDNTHVCPLGVDQDFLNNPYNPQDKVIFYTQGKREVRKGHDYLHKVFAKAFPGNENVELWMFTHNVFDDQKTTRKFQTEYRQLLGDKVKFFPWLPKQEMLKWLGKADFGLFLSRAEGWNMPLLESMAMGKDVLATYYSGHTEFLPEDQSFKPESFVEAFDGKWFNGGFVWVKIEDSEDEIIEKLRKMYRNKDQTTNETNRQIAKQFTWERTAKEVLNGIQRV